MDEPCSALDPIATARIEELIDELRRTTRSSSSPTPCSRRRACRSRPPSSTWQADRGRADRRDLHQPARRAHPGLHHRPLRLTARRRTMACTSTSSSPSRTSCRASPHDRRDGRPGRAARRRSPSTRSLSRDPELAQRVIDGDERDRRAERDIEEQAIRLIALRQPMARDLRQTVAAIQIATDLERIGDLAKNIAKRVACHRASRPSAATSRVGVERMAELALEPAEGRARRLSPRATSTKALEVWRARRRGRRASTTRCSASCSPT